MSRRYLTNEYLRAEADQRGVCPGCFGWGFPVMAFNGRELVKPHLRCPDCKGTGRRSMDSLTDNEKDR